MTGASAEREYGSMQQQEYLMLGKLLAETRPSTTLEIGMANGESTAVICRFLRDNGGARHVAMDPFQSRPDGWAGRGLERLRREGLLAYLDFVEDFDYLVLPRLVAEMRRFDFILIDGWHSFDYTLLDFFYADLLLRPGGVVVFHDTDWPSVHKAIRFLETHKPYDRLSPMPLVQVRPLIGRVLRRVRHLFGGRRVLAEARSRRTEWLSLSAYRKRADCQIPSNFFLNRDRPRLFSPPPPLRRPRESSPNL